MKTFRHRPSGLPVLAVLMIATAGCSSADDPPSAAVPRPGAAVAKLCRNLDEGLPKRVEKLARRDPEPASVLTAGWGNPAIILRCGVERPAKMADPEADGVEVDGVGWLLEQQPDKSFHFTTTLRKAYVEVTIPAERTGDGLAPLANLAPAVEHAIPKGVAD
ncbi:DUF3515 domain-containing protein [Streptomyces sp. NPDC001068]|uniref:DUF3515 domain-containing protein n=1 Tax=Streptomyces sp. NPDC001068 TaxID=3364544 RepID=UPI00368C145A